MGCITSSPRLLRSPRKGEPPIQPVNQRQIAESQQLEPVSERGQYLPTAERDPDFKANVNINKLGAETIKTNGGPHSASGNAITTAAQPPVPIPAAVQPIQESKDPPARTGSGIKTPSRSNDVPLSVPKKPAEHRPSFTLQPLPPQKIKQPVPPPQRRLKPMPAPRAVTTPTNEEVDGWKEKIDHAIKEFVQNTTLTTLNLSGLGLGLEKGEAIDGQNHLKGAFGTGTLRTLITFVATNSRPMALDLSKNSFRGELDGGHDSRASKLSAVLQLAACTSLTSLDLRSNDLSPKDGQQIAKVFCSRFSDYVGSNGVENGVADPNHSSANRENQDSQKPTPKTGANTCTLSGICVSSCFNKATGNRINLYNQTIGPAECAMLSEVIAQSPCSGWLQCLDLNRNCIGSEGCKALLPGLCSLSMLEILQIGVNDIGDAGCLTLCTAFSKTTSLKALYLYENNISEIGCTSLLHCLTAHPSVNQLYLSHNPIGFGGYQALAATFGNIKWVALGLRNLSLDQDVLAVIDHTPLLTTIQFLDLMENRVDSQSPQAIELMNTAQTIKNARLLLPSCPSPVSTSPHPANRGGGGGGGGGADAARNGGLYRRSSVRAGTAGPMPTAAPAGGNGGGSGGGAGAAEGGGGSLGAHLWDDATTTTALPRYIQAKDQART